MDAFVEAKMARHLSPFSPLMHFSLGLLLYASSQNEEAIEQLRDTVAMDAKFPLSHLVLGLTFGRKGRFDEAIAEFKQALTIAGVSPLWSGFLGQVFASAGKTEDASRILNELFATARNRYVPSVAFAVVYAGLGKTDDAFHWLGKAVDERDGLLIYLEVGSVFDSLRSDPRFSLILTRVGLQRDSGLDVIHPLPRPIPQPPPRPRPLLKNLLFGVAAAIFVVIVASVVIPRLGELLWPSRTILAIQPFKTLGGDLDSRRLAEIVREEVFTRLSEVHPLKLGVVELTTADSELSFEQVCENHKPTYILAGAVHRDGNQLAITDQLVSCKDQTGLVGDRHALNPDGAGTGAAVDNIVQKILAALPKDILPAAHQVNPESIRGLLAGAFRVESAHYTELDAGQLLLSTGNRIRRVLCTLLRWFGRLLRSFGIRTQYCFPAERSLSKVEGQCVKSACVGQRPGRGSCFAGIFRAGIRLELPRS